MVLDETIHDVTSARKEKEKWEKKGAGFLGELIGLREALGVAASKAKAKPRAKQNSAAAAAAQPQNTAAAAGPSKKKKKGPDSDTGAGGPGAGFGWGAASSAGGSTRVPGSAGGTSSTGTWEEEQDDDQLVFSDDETGPAVRPPADGRRAGGRHGTREHLSPAPADCPSPRPARWSPAAGPPRDRRSSSGKVVPPTAAPCVQQLKTPAWKLWGPLPHAEYYPLGVKRRRFTCSSTSSAC